MRKRFFILRALRALIYPPACAVCDKVLSDRHALVCGTCRAKLPWVREPVCMVCGRPLDAGIHPRIQRPAMEERREKCGACEREKIWYDKGAGTFLYTGDIQRSILRMKFHNRRDHLDFYAAALVHAHGRFLQQIHADGIVPVPMHRRKKKERGFDQCDLLARRLADLTGLPVLDGVLERVRYTRPQKGLHAAERRANLHNAFAVRDLPADIRCVILLDDIFTTGATLNEAARTLRMAGAEHVYVLTVCMAAPRP